MHQYHTDRSIEIRPIHNYLNIVSVHHTNLLSSKYLIAIQCLARCRHARNVLRICRAAAKDLGKLQLSNDVLKLEIEQLRAKARNETRRVLAEAEERSVRLFVLSLYVRPA